MLDTNPTMNTKWESYRHEVVPPAAPMVQVIECKRAFYAGAAAFFDCMVTALDGTDDGKKKMDALHAELLKFANNGAMG